MYIYILLTIFTLTAADVGDQSWWSFMRDIFKITHEEIVPEDARLNITQLAFKYGYPLEQHPVVTEDGYILNLFRIPKRQNAPVVFLMHGLLEKSDSWMIMGPGKALAYVLADEGFDVWMGNARGNDHALQHVTLNYTMPQYWRFSWEEIALYDLPAMIDYILAVTRQHKLYYIGHSQGTTTSYVLCSMKPEYNDKIKMVVSLAPEAFMGHVKSPLVRILSAAQNILKYLLQDVNLYSAGLNFFNKISSFTCSILPGRCNDILYLLSGYESKVNSTLLAVLLGHMPSGSSMLQFVHYGQLVQSERFCRYDHGLEENMNRYGQITPPDYDLSKMTVPVMIFYSQIDCLSDPHDVDKLRNGLPNVSDYIFLEDFTHIDYTYAEEAVDVIYSRIIARFKFEEHHEVRHNEARRVMSAVKYPCN